MPPPSEGRPYRIGVVHKAQAAPSRPRCGSAAPCWVWSMANDPIDRSAHEIVPWHPKQAIMSSPVVRTRSIWPPPLTVGVFGITVVCGMLDAASFLGLGLIFVETMTGNIILL